MNLKLALRIVFVLVWTSMLAAGCTHRYVPDVLPLPDEPGSGLSSPSTLSILNAQESTDEVLFLTNGPHEFHANLQEWTDVAVKMVERELTDHGVTIADSGERSIEMAVVSVTSTTGGWGFRTYVYLTAETGDGYKGVYNGQGPHNIVAFAANEALRQAVMKMLGDETIRQYVAQ